MSDELLKAHAEIAALRTFIFGPAHKLLSKEELEELHEDDCTDVCTCGLTALIDPDLTTKIMLDWERLRRVERAARAFTDSTQHYKIAETYAELQAALEVPRHL